MSKNEETELSWLQGLSDDDTSTTRADIEQARRDAGAAARDRSRPAQDSEHDVEHDHDDWLRSLGGVVPGAEGDGTAVVAEPAHDEPVLSEPELDEPSLAESEQAAAEQAQAEPEHPGTEGDDNASVEPPLFEGTLTPTDAAEPVAAHGEPRPADGQSVVDETIVDEPVDAPATTTQVDGAPAVTDAPVTEAEVTEAVVTEAVVTEQAAAGAVVTEQVDEVAAPAAEPKKKSRWRKPALIASAAAVVLLGAGGGIALALTKEITVQADGQTVTVSTFAGDVAGALAAAEISLGEYDKVSPDLTAEIADEDTVVVDRARLVTVSLDGELHETWTTVETLDEALDELGVSAGNGERLELSADRSAAIPEDGLAVDAVITFPVTVTDGAEPAVQVRTDVDTVADLLAAQDLELGEHDVVTPAAKSALAPGTTVQIDRVLISPVVEQVEIAQPADQQVPDAELNEGLVETAEAGNPGTEAVTYQVTTVNGVETERVETSREVQVEAKASVVRVGTRVPDPAEKYADPANWSVNWDGIARCESTNNWSINTGNGYYGGLQFDRRTWQGSGGGVYGDTANLATKEQQIYIAEKLYASRGLQPWACGHAG